jgi:hypothetical protein
MSPPSQEKSTCTRTSSSIFRPIRPLSAAMQQRAQAVLRSARPRHGSLELMEGRHADQHCRDTRDCGFFVHATSCVFSRRKRLLRFLSKRTSAQQTKGELARKKEKEHEQPALASSSHVSFVCFFPTKLRAGAGLLLLLVAAPAFPPSSFSSFFSFSYCPPPFALYDKTKPFKMKSPPL